MLQLLYSTFAAFYQRLKPIKDLIEIRLLAKKNFARLAVSIGKSTVVVGNEFLEQKCYYLNKLLH